MEPEVCNNSARLSAIIKSCMLWDFSNQNHEMCVYIYIKKKRQKRSQWDRCHRFYFLTWGNDEELLILCDLNVSKSFNFNLIMIKWSLLYQLFHYWFLLIFQHISFLINEKLQFTKEGIEWLYKFTLSIIVWYLKKGQKYLRLVNWPAICISGWFGKH